MKNKINEMEKLINILKKQGGINLIKQYWQSGAFFTAIGELLLLGRSRTALEILRLSAQLKVKQKIKKIYMQDLISFDKEYNTNLAHEASRKVWVCWLQGIENAPEIVKKCYQSLKSNLKNREIILITLENMFDYVQFPEHIIEKWKAGKISYTHLTDLLRLELLICYGGMWLDATVLCTKSDIPNYFFDSDLFFYQVLKPGRDGHSHFCSSWLISAKTNNKILMATQDLCYKYWKTHNSLIDYFLLHDFISIVLEYYFEDWQRIVPCDNATPHILLLRLFENYDESVWNSIKEQTAFHKLSYKFTKEQEQKRGTYYQYLFLQD